MSMMQDIPATQFDILRHGECEGGNIFRGSTDVALLPEGLQNMHRACDLANAKFGEKASDNDADHNSIWDIVVASPLVRCHDFAKSYAEKNALPFVVDDRLREIFFGEWEGLQIEHIWRDRQEQISQWMEDPAKYTPPNGEPLAEVYQRVDAFFDDARQAYQGKRVLLVTHGGVIRVLLTSLLEMPIINTHRFDVPYASMSRVNIFHMEQGDRIKLTAHNFI